MKLHFDYNIDKDIENFINGTRAVNSKKPTKFQIAFSEMYGDNFEPEKVKVFIEEQDKINDFDANKEIVAVEERWKIAEPIFIERVEKIFDISYPAPIITVYLTHNERCTYNIEQNYFFVRIGSEFSNNTIMHELLHFYTWHAFGKKLLDEGLSKLAYNDIKESLTELLNLEFSDLLNGKPDTGYPQHQEMRAEVKKFWLDKKDVKSLVMLLNENQEKVFFVNEQDVKDKINSLFISEKEKLQKLLPHSQIEHIGGTSIKGSVTKGDLDINVRVAKEDLSLSVEILKKIYEINQPKNWTENYTSFKDDSRDLGIQLTVLDSQDDVFVRQRDFLNSNPEKVSELNKIKMSFDGKNMTDYRKEKGKFFESIKF